MSDPHEIALDGYPLLEAGLPEGVAAVRDLSAGLTVVACSHRVARLSALGGTREWCSFCHGDAATTDEWRLPVKRLVRAPKELTLL